VAALVPVQRAQLGIPAAASCRELGVSRPWYYKWSGRGCRRGPRAWERLKAKIRRLFELHEASAGRQ
jgi:hypothetical protein